MTTVISDSESDTEIFEAALRDMEEAVKLQPNKKPTTGKSQTEKKREKLLELSKDGLIEKHANFIRKSNKSVVDKLYNEYENQRMSCASDFLSTLIISKFASVLGSLNAVESSEKLSEELLNDKLLKDDVAYLTRTISPNIPFIGLISGLPQIGEPYEWGNPWEETEFEDIINELTQKTDENRERLTKLETTVEGIQYDLKSPIKETIKVVNNIYKKNSEV
ncbi:Hypothetical predicted protein [Paramuricea clavata]|uniref:Uncharacterized protein n=1 Tax=Paramuricea clavata TaxID=317549 RepID=A0A6S7G9F7_PARCT|nr:Hypothetical predicted protein [Paramuricea clavata]